ncbi:hypothetical protein Peur_031562 [Populus x canadensis]
MDSYFSIFEEIQAAKDAEELLENLSFLDQNVVLMAKATYFKPLLRLLSAGCIHNYEPCHGNYVLKKLIASRSHYWNLRKFSAVQGLVQSCEHDHNIAAMGVISNLPNDPQITMWLLDAGAFQLFVVQEIVAQAEIIPMLVQLLVFGTALTKQSAAISLKQLSKSLSTLSSTSDPMLPLRMLGEADLGVCEASLDALLTLVDGQRLQSGSKVLAEANAIIPIIKLLSSPSATVYRRRY